MFVSLGRKCESCRGIKRSWRSSWISSVCSTDVFSMWHWTSCLKMLYIISVSFTWNKGEWAKEKKSFDLKFSCNFREQTWNMNAEKMWNEGHVNRVGRFFYSKNFFYSWYQIKFAANKNSIRIGKSTEFILIQMIHVNHIFPTLYCVYSILS